MLQMWGKYAMVSNKLCIRRLIHFNDKGSVSKSAVLTRLIRNCRKIIDHFSRWDMSVKYNQIPLLAFQNPYQSLCLTPVCQSKQKPCSLPKHSLHAVCSWQSSTCNAAEANGIAPHGPSYCAHSSSRDDSFSFFLFFGLMKCIGFSTPNISSKLPNPFHSTENGETETEMHLCLFVVFVHLQRSTRVLRDPVSKLSREKLMQVYQAWELQINNWVRGLYKTLR